MFFSKLEYRGFEVTDYDLATRLPKFKMAEPFWEWCDIVIDYALN